MTGGCGRWWPMIGKALQVTEQHGLVTRFLPNNSDAEFLRASIRIVSFCRIIIDLV